VAEAAFQMSPEQIEAFLEVPRHAIVAALRGDGTAQMSPVWYLYQEGRLYFSMLVATAKYRQLRRDPRVALCIDGGHPDARFVALYGVAQLVEEESPWRDDIAWRIVRRYIDSDEEARSWQAEVAARGRQALVVVTPERILGRDYN
jgi:PPOX class probable F420-dependent enzyme